MEVILAFLIGVGSTLVVQWVLSLYREGLNRAHLKQLQKDLREQLGGKLEAMNAAKGVENLEYQTYDIPSISERFRSTEEEIKREVEQDRPATLEELDSSINVAEVASDHKKVTVSIERVSPDNVPSDRPLTFKEVAGL